MHSILLEATTTPSSMAGLSTILMVVITLAVMYFFLIRPQKKQEKETANMLDNLAVGDEITTIGGGIGEIGSITGETVVVATSRDQTKIRFRKTAIKSVDVHANEKP